MRDDSRPGYRLAPRPRRTAEDIAETLSAPDEYLWAVKRRRAWCGVVVSLLIAVFASLSAVGYVGGRQAYVFSGRGTPSTHELRLFFDSHIAKGITLAQSAPAVPDDWARQLSKNLRECWDREQCRAVLTGPQWALWQAKAGYWFPELAWAIAALQASAGGFLMALVMYLYAFNDADAERWRRWEQLQRLEAGRAQRERQRRGG